MSPAASSAEASSATAETSPATRSGQRSGTAIAVRRDGDVSGAPHNATVGAPVGWQAMAGSVVTARLPTWMADGAWRRPRKPKALRGSDNPI